ncbi:MAG TPA: hypothetical protein VMW07_07715 [Gallionella sp.]|jgi:hypothetical protein|nr:hypothetical protein [Gallionella sp.]
MSIEKIPSPELINMALARKLSRKICLHGEIDYRTKHYKNFTRQPLYNLVLGIGLAS